MDEVRKRIEEIKKHPHCVNCGIIHPEMVEDSEMPKAYTKCCHEAVCDQLLEYTFGNNEVSVKACCWAIAELEFKAKGVDVAKQQGMRRLS